MTEHYSFTQLSMEAECQKKYLIGYGFGIRPKTIAMPMIRGRAYHKCVATWHSKYDKNKALAASLKILLEISTFKPSEVEDKEKLIQDLTVTEMAYMSHYTDDGVIQYTHIEQGFEVVIGNIIVKFIPDALGIITSNNRDIIIEQKSVSQIDKNFMSRAEIDTQSNLYIYLLRRVFGPSYNPLRMFRITKLSSLKRRKSRKTNLYTESESDFQQRIIQDYICEPDKYFINEQFEPDEDKIELAGSELQWIVKDIESKLVKCNICKRYKKGIQSCITTCGLWYRDTSKCSLRGGCSFLPLCRNYKVNRIFYFQNKDKAKLCMT